MLDKLWDLTAGTKWRNWLIALILASVVWTFSGSFVHWSLSTYADETLNHMLKERGITQESFQAVQKKLLEIDDQTNGLKKDLGELKVTLNSLVQEQTVMKSDLQTSQKRSIDERKELQETVTNIYNYLLNHPIERNH